MVLTGEADDVDKTADVREIAACFTTYICFLRSVVALRSTIFTPRHRSAAPFGGGTPEGRRPFRRFLATNAITEVRHTCSTCFYG